MQSSLDIDSLWNTSENRSVYGYQLRSDYSDHLETGLDNEISILFHPPESLPESSQSMPWIHHIKEAQSQNKVWFSISRRDENFSLHFNRCGNFLVKPGLRIIECTPSLTTDRHTLQHVLINQVIPRMLSQLGETVLHASAVSMKDANRSVAFMGASGAGKSTLAAYFCQNGAALMTDDCLRIVAKENQDIQAIPSYPAIRIWSDSLDKIVSDFKSNSSPVTSCYNDKPQYTDKELNFEYCESPSPLAAIFLLEPQDNPSEKIKVLRSSQKNTLGIMISNCFRLDVEDRSILKNEFRKLSELARIVPAFEIKYPKDWDDLKEIHSLVLDQLDIIT